MPSADEDIFAKMLKSELQYNIYLFCGNDDFLKEHYSNLLTKKVVDEALMFFNFHKYEDNAAPLYEVFADAENLPVMSEKTCIFVKNYSLDKLGSKELAEFENMLKGIPETTVIVFYFSADFIPSGKNAKWDTVIKLFERLGCVVRTDHRSPAKLAKLLSSRAKERGTSIDTDTAVYLINAVGEDMQTVLNEFNKVCAFSEGKPITEEMIDMTATKSVEASVFDISTSIFSGNTDRAYSILNELLRQKVQSSAVIGALANSYVNAYRLKAAFNAGMTAEDFYKDYQYRETRYTFGKIAPFVKKSTISSLRKAVAILAEADKKSKSSAVADDILLTELISKLASCRSE